MSLTTSDFFCGAGGSSTGLSQVPGIEVKLALNHWAKAIETHTFNHPRTDHACADIAHIQPRFTPHTDLLWASPECTNFTNAKGVARKTWAEHQDSLFEGLEGAPLPKEAAVRSRATMYDVPRFAEFHRYEAVMLENVPEVTKWLPFRGWMMSMLDLGYESRVVSMNSMHAQAYGAGAPQSRDRTYIVFWRKGNKAPDFDRLRPFAECPMHGRVQCMQVFKNPKITIGKYRQQYLWRCPRTECRNQVLEPAVRPAADAIDWTIKGVRLGDRKKPLAANTMRQVVEGLNKFPFADSILTQFYGSPSPKPTTDPFTTFTTRDRHGLVVTLRRNAMATPAEAAPFTTITAGGNHHGLMQYSLDTVEDVQFRMIQPHEQMRGMDFPHDYTILGTMKERTAQAGNAVCPPNSRDIGHIVAESLGVAA